MCLNSIFAQYCQFCLENNLVRDNQNHFLECTKEILAGLGQMYVNDERFENNIDKHTKGTAEFVQKAIEIYCN